MPYRCFSIVLIACGVLLQAAAMAWSQTGDVAKPVLLDDFGDALPPGAIARLGTLRLQHAGKVRSLAVSSDGQFVVSGATGRSSSSVIVWALQTGKQVFNIEGKGCFVAISPDSAVLATSGEQKDTHVHLWDLKTGEMLRQIEVKGTEGAPVESIGSIAFSPDGQSLAVKTSWVKVLSMPMYPRFKTIRFLKLKTAEEIETFSVPDENGYWPTLFEYSPDGKWLAVIGGKQHTVYLLDAETMRVNDTLGSIASACAWSADGKKLAIAHAQPKKIRLIDIDTRKDVRSFGGFPGYNGSAAGPIALSPDGIFLAAAGGHGDPQVRLWNIETGQLIPFAQRYQRGKATDLSFTPDGKQLVCANGSRVQMWSIADGTETVLNNVPRGPIRWAAFSPDGRTVGVCEGIRGTSIYSIPTRNFLRHFGECEYVQSAAFSPDGATLATAGTALRLWHSAMGAEIRTLQAGPDVVDRDKYGLSCAEFFPDGNRLVSGGDAGILRLWNVNTGEEIRHYQQPINNDHHPDPVRGAVVLPGGKKVATIAGNVNLWDLERGEVVSTFDGYTEGDVGRPIAISPDGKLLAFQTIHYSKGPESPYNVVIQEVDGDQRSWRLDDPAGPRSTLYNISVAFSSDGRFLATGGGDKSVRLWDVATRKELCRFDGHIDHVSCVDFSPDGKTLASASADGTVLFWDVSSLEAGQ